jgi:protein SCO1/2
MSLFKTAVCVVALASAAACSSPPTYELQGQIVAVDEAKQQLTVKHGDIRNFMPAMTMAYTVKDKSMMEGRTPGDLITATLLVDDSRGYLTSIKVTGHAPLTEPPPSAAFDLLEPGENVPDIPLIDQDGNTRQLSDWRGEVVAVTFIYTRCPLPDFCPLMDKHFAAIQREADADPRLKGRVHLVSVSIDPAFDTPAVLRDHATRAGARPDDWTFLTGTPENVKQLGERFGVSVMTEGATDGSLIHNLRTAVIDPDGRLTTVFGGNDWSAADLLKQVRHAAGLS